MSTMEITYRDGKLDKVLLHQPQEVRVQDCRNHSACSFVSLEFSGGCHKLMAFMPPTLAEELLTKLQNLLHPREEKKHVQT